MGGPEFSIPPNILKLQALRGENSHILPSPLDQGRTHTYCLPPLTKTQGSAPGGPTKPSRILTGTAEGPRKADARESRLGLHLTSTRAPAEDTGAPRGLQRCHPLPVDMRKQASLLGALQNKGCGALKKKRGVPEDCLLHQPQIHHGQQRGSVPCSTQGHYLSVPHSGSWSECPQTLRELYDKIRGTHAVAWVPPKSVQNDKKKKEAFKRNRTLDCHYFQKLLFKKPPPHPRHTHLNVKR